MNTEFGFPSFDRKLPELNKFIVKLTEEYDAGKITSWKNLDKRVKNFFTRQQLDDMERIAPGWKKMASYSDGITLTHVTCVFLGMFMLPEFKSLSDEQQQIAKWIILFHDIDKAHIHGKKDAMHAFRSGALAAKTLPELGFPTGDQYHKHIEYWTTLAINAFVKNHDKPWQKPDNKKLPEILEGIDVLFGKNTAANLITKVALLHISLDVDTEYVTPSPLTDEETKKFITSEIFPLLRVMMLSDNEGWSMFDPKPRARQRKDTLEVFTRVESIIMKKDK